ncbi:MAG: peptide-methionine (S)-S-oxide reductase MsrA [Actinomycetota bacterium]
MRTVVIAGGCFWCLDATYRQFKGVHSVVSGYAGGHIDSPSYEQVCEGNTGHAEVVRIEFDPAVISPETIYDIFFVIHDPTQLNRQGMDVGTQYRSAMFYESEVDKAEFEGAIERANTNWGDQIVTSLEPLTKFWPAEDYHQDFFAKNPGQGYCMAVVSPKVAKARQKFAYLLR